MSFETACSSLYSLMSRRKNDPLVLSKRCDARVLASNVLPTPDGPKNIKTPVGRSGSLRPARERKIACETVLTARFCPTTALLNVCSRFKSCWASVATYTINFANWYLKIKWNLVMILFGKTYRKTHTKKINRKTKKKKRILLSYQASDWNACPTRNNFSDNFWSNDVLQFLY